MANLDPRYAASERSRAIEEYSSGTLVALAGPGTGKTFSLRKRIRDLVDQRDVAPKSIAYVTFNREMTGKFRKELIDEFGTGLLVPRARIYTLHALALRLIRSKGPKVLGLTGQLEPLNIDAKDPLARIFREDLRNHLDGHHYKTKLKVLRQHLTSAKKQWQNGVQFPLLAGEAQPIMEAYYRLSRAFKAIDWGQVVVCANEICEELPLLPDWLRSIEHFLVDEYQDFNLAEQRFLREIMAGAESAVIVGDDDQSLYSWRGASREGIVNLVAAPHVDSLSLVVSHRCKSEVVEAANAFLRYMRPDPKQLVALHDGGRVRIKYLKSAKAEVDSLVEHLTSIIQGIPIDAPKDEGVACLFPSWTVLDQYQKDFEKRGMVCDVRRTVEETEEGMVARALARLAVLGTQPFLERVILKQFPGMKGRPEGQVINRLLLDDSTVREAVGALAGNGQWGPSRKAAAREYQEFLDGLTSKDPEMVSSCFERLLSGVAGCDPGLVEDFLVHAEENLENAVEELLQRMLRIPTDSGESQRKSPKIELMTMHGAKGLTRKQIVIPGCEDYWLPTRAARADPEEQKRLFYVAITRATDEVLITCPRNRARNDSLNLRKEGCLELSRFARQLNVTPEWC